MLQKIPDVTCHTILPSFLPSFLTYLPYLPTYCLTYLLSYFLTYLPTHLPAYLLACLLACLLPCFLACLLACFLAYLLTCLLAYLLTCLLAYLLTHLPACLRACLLAWFLTLLLSCYCFLTYLLTSLVFNRFPAYRLSLCFVLFNCWIEPWFLWICVPGRLWLVDSSVLSARLAWGWACLVCAQAPKPHPGEEFRLRSEISRVFAAAVPWDLDKLPRVWEHEGPVQSRHAFGGTQHVQLAMLQVLRLPWSWTIARDDHHDHEGDHRHMCWWIWSFGYTRTTSCSTGASFALCLGLGSCCMLLWECRKGTWHGQPMDTGERMGVALLPKKNKKICHGYRPEVPDWWHDCWLFRIDWAELTALTALSLRFRWGQK